MREAVSGAKRGTPQRTTPVNVQMQFTTTLIPEIAEAFPTIKRVAPDTVAFSSQTMPDAYRLIRVLYRYINPD